MTVVTSDHSFASFDSIVRQYGPRLVERFLCLGKPRGIVFVHKTRPLCSRCGCCPYYVHSVSDSSTAYDRHGNDVCYCVPSLCRWNEKYLVHIALITGLNPDVTAGLCGMLCRYSFCSSACQAVSAVLCPTRRSVSLLWLPT